MKEQGRRFVWKKREKLLKQVIRVEGSYGNYSALLLPNKRYVILDRSNLKFLLPSSGPLYTLPNDWKQWMKRGLIVVAFYKAFYFYKYYIFSTQDKRLIIKAREVEAYAFLKDESDYFVVKNDDSKEAIFDKNGEQISDWFDQIFSGGLVVGESDYYVVRRNEKEAIFHKDGKQVTEWLNWIEPYGLVWGQSDYYIAVKDMKAAIFHKEGQRITDWYNDIDEYGLVTGESDFYIAKKGGKAAIFHRDGRQISDWFDDIDEDGLVRGQSDYYLAKADKFNYICKLGSTKVVGPYNDIFDHGFIKDPSRDTIRIKTLDNQQITLTKQEVEQLFEDKDAEDEKTR
jgi:hypothetical protein